MLRKTRRLKKDLLFVGELFPHISFIPIQTKSNQMSSSFKIKYIFLLCFALSGCYSPKVANKYIAKVQSKNPKLLQDILCKYYPTNNQCGWLVVKMTKKDSIDAVKVFDNPKSVKAPIPKPNAKAKTNYQKKKTLL